MNQRNVVVVVVAVVVLVPSSPLLVPVPEQPIVHKRE